MRFRNLLVVLMFFSIASSLASVSASKVCDLDIELLNQDPYPALQGEYVELVFQVTGLVQDGCGDISFELVDNYPLVFDPGQSRVKKYAEFSYTKDASPTLLIPFKVRVDSYAVDGANPIEVKLINDGDSPMFKTFDLEVTDARADFEIYVKNYDYSTNEVTLEMINIGKSDTYALTVEIPKQEGITVKGSNKVVVGDLDSNDYTTAEFEATIEDGEFDIVLVYSDSINVRRTVEKKVSFNSDYFTNRKADEVTPSYVGYYVLIGVLLFIGYIIYKRVSRAKAKKRRLASA